MSNSIKKADILFSDPLNGENILSLKVALNALKSLGLRNYYNFSHISSTNSLIPNSSLYENILIECFPSLSHQDQEKKFKAIVEQSSEIRSLYSAISSSTTLAKKANDKDLLLTNLIKAFVSKRPLQIIESFEGLLNEFELKLVKRSIFNLNKDNQITFYIISKDITPWEEIIHKTITRAKNGKFECVNYKTKTPVINDKNSNIHTESSLNYYGVNSSVQQKKIA